MTTLNFGVIIVSAFLVAYMYIHHRKKYDVTTPTSFLRALDWHCQSTGSVGTEICSLMT